MPEDESDLAYFLAALPAEIPVTVDRAWLQPDRARRRRAGRRGPARPRLQRGRRSRATRVRAGTAVPDVKVARAAQEAGIAGLAFLRGIPGAIGGALRMNGGAYGRETKDALVEARGVDRAGQHPRLQQRRHALHLPALRRAGRRHLHRRRCSRARRAIRAAIAAEMDKITEVARGDAADQEPHRRLDLQESARQQGLAIDRRRRLPRADRRRRAGVGTALQFPDQPRRRHRGRYRDARRNRAASA